MLISHFHILYSPEQRYQFRINNFLSRVQKMSGQKVAISVKMFYKLEIKIEVIKKK